MRRIHSLYVGGGYYSILGSILAATESRHGGEYRRQYTNLHHGEKGLLFYIVAHLDVFVNEGGK